VVVVVVVVVACNARYPLKRADGSRADTPKIMYILLNRVDYS
jgi:hypothetical protein